MAVNKFALAKHSFAKVALPERAAIKFLVADFLMATILAGEGLGDVFVLGVVEISHDGYFTLPSSHPARAPLQ